VRHKYVTSFGWPVNGVFYTCFWLATPIWYLSSRRRSRAYAACYMRLVIMSWTARVCKTVKRDKKLSYTNSRYKYSAYHSVSTLVASCLHRLQYRHVPSELYHEHSMKYTIILATLLAFVAAQTIDGLPICSVGCLKNAMSKAGCATTDTTCTCSKADAINEDITPCIERACSSWDDYEFRYIVTKICYIAGVPIQGMSSSRTIITGLPIQEESSSTMMYPHMRHSTHNPCKYSTTHAMFVSLTLI
jgi:hypothetical protein